MNTRMDQAQFQHYCREQHFTAQTQDLLARLRHSPPAARKATIRGELVIYPPHTPLRIPRANKGPLWIRQGTTWTKR